MFNKFYVEYYEIRQYLVFIGTISAVRSEIDNLLKAKKVVVISLSNCPYCKTAKQVLAKYNISKAKMYIRELDNDPNREEILRYMLQLTGARSVPRVFIGGKFVGGGSNIQAMHTHGQLAPLLKRVGAI